VMTLMGMDARPGQLDVVGKLPQGFPEGIHRRGPRRDAIETGVENTRESALQVMRCRSLDAGDSLRGPNDSRSSGQPS
jgi:hypothetical protein